jgi:RND family efflux transporter MFP subunit
MIAKPFCSWKAPRGGRAVVSSFLIALFLLTGIPPMAGASPDQEPSSVSGITEPKRDLTLGLTLPGIVSKVLLKEGDQVKEGQVILQLDKRIEELEMNRRKVIWECKAEIESAKARVNTLGPQVKATRSLFESTKSVSREDLEKIELDYELAFAEKERLEVEEQRQSIEYDMAVENFRKRQLVSPIQGTIISLFLDEGECYREGQPLVRVVDTSRCLLVCRVEEALGRTFKRGQKVEMNIRAGKGFVRKQGTMAFVSPVADPSSGLIEVKVEFENQEGEVRPGVQGYLLLDGR